MTNAILRGKPDAGNPHVRFDEGEVALAKPRRESLLYNGQTSLNRSSGATKALLGLVAVCALQSSLWAQAPIVSNPLRLTEDADWRRRGLVTLDPEASIDLDGHQLWVDGFSKSFGGEDATTPDSAKAHADSTVYAGTVACLFDNNFKYDFNTNHRLCANAFPVLLRYDFGEGEERRIRAYKIHYNSIMNDGSRAPQAWTFEGSNDGITWEVLDRRSGESNWKAPESRVYAFVNDAEFQQYRLKIEKVTSGVLELYQLEFFELPFEISDVTVPDPSRVTSTALFSGDAKFLFDNEFRYSALQGQEHRICATAMPFDVTYDCGDGHEKCVNGYRIYFDANGPEAGQRAPQSWEFAGSLDGTTWTTLDRRQDETQWRKPCVRTFWFANAAAYRFYRLRVNKYTAGSNCVELYQLEFLNQPSVTDPFPELDVDQTEPGAEHVHASSSKPYQNLGQIANLFDNRFEWSGAGQGDHRVLFASYRTGEDTGIPFNIVYDFGTGRDKNIRGYAIYYQSALSDGRRAPADWTFAGSDDAVNWMTLDTQKDVTNWTAKCSKSFAFTNPRHYRYYRLQIAKGNGDSYVELYQLEFYSPKPSALHVDVKADETVRNVDVAVMGAVKTVKEGAGTFETSIASLSMGGEIDVVGGTLKTLPDGTQSTVDSDGIRRVTVSPDGVFDISRCDGSSARQVCLAGGTLVCGPSSRLETIDLSSDSRLEVSGDFAQGAASVGLLDLAGRKLDVSISGVGPWSLDVSEVSSGTLAFEIGHDKALVGKRIMSWQTGPENVKFTGTPKSFYSIDVRGDGVYVAPKGFVILCR